MENVGKDSEPLRLSEIELVPVRPTAGLIGFAGLTLNQSLRLNGIAIYTRPGGGLRLVFPTRKLRNGTDIPLYFPISKEAGQLFEDALRTAFEQLLPTSSEIAE